MTKKTSYPFKNLVFQGGGIKSFVYHGVLRVLAEQGILDQIERVAGTSAGALQAALMCFRLDVEETIELYKTIDFSKIRSGRIEPQPQPRRSHPMVDESLDRARDGLDAAGRFFRRYGLYSTSYMRHYLHHTIAAYCDGNGQATFAEFRQRGFRDLYTTAVNLSQRRAEIFSADTTPDVAVADAVLMSAAIPFFFEAIRFDGKTIGQGDYYIDGGALNNYPLTIFDNLRFEEGNRNFTYGVNWETLGCQLFTPKECSRQSTEINHLIQYAEALVETLGEAQNFAVDVRTVDRVRSIRISNCCVSTVDFDIQPSDDDPKYLEMVQTGREAALAYLESYHLPTDRFAEFKETLRDLLQL
jgi:NTE family protein